jgi:hypothetical protein
LALIILLGQRAYAAAQQNNDEAAIKQVVVTAAGASLQAVVAPNTHADYSTDVKALAASPTDLSVAQTQAHSLFNSVDAPTCAPCQTEASKTYQALQAEGKGTFRALGWRVSDVVWRQVLLNDQTASVVVSMTLWSKVQYVDEFGKLHTLTPTGGVVLIYSLAKLGGNWLITNQVSDDAAASSLPVNQLKQNGSAGGPPADQLPPAKNDPTNVPAKNSSAG